MSKLIIVESPTKPGPGFVRVTPEIIKIMQEQNDRWIEDKKY